MLPIRSHLAGASGLTLVLELPASLDHETAQPLYDEAARRLPNCDGAGLILDASQLVQITSLGITALLQIQEFAARRSAPLLVASLPEPVRAFLARLKLDSRFDAAPSVEDAVAQLDAR